MCPKLSKVVFKSFISSKMLIWKSEICRWSTSLDHSYATLEYMQNDKFTFFNLNTSSNLHEPLQKQIHLPHFLTHSATCFPELLCNFFKSLWFIFETVPESRFARFYKKNQFTQRFFENRKTNKIFKFRKHYWGFITKTFKMWW